MSGTPNPDTVTFVPEFAATPSPLLWATILLATLCAAGPYQSRAQYPIGFGSSSADEGSAVVIDAAGNAYVTGYFNGTVDFDPGVGTHEMTALGSGTGDIFLASYTSTGDLRFAHAFGSTSTDRSNALVLDASNNIYITGGFRGTIDFDPGAGTHNLSPVGSSNTIFVASYTSTGDFRFAFSIGGSTSAVGYGLGVDGNDNIYLTGTFSGSGVDIDPGAGTTTVTSAGSLDILIASYTSSGAFRFGFGIGGSGLEGASYVAVDGANNIYVTGTFTGTGVDFDPSASTVALNSNGSNDIYVASYTSGGAFRWAINVGSAGGEAVNGIAVDAAGNSFIVGYFSTAFDFDPGAGTQVVSVNGGQDGYLASYTPAGAYSFAFALGGANASSGTDNAFGVLADGATVYAVGTFHDTADFDPGAGTASLTHAGNGDGYIASYTTAGAYQNVTSFSGTGSELIRSIAVNGTGTLVTTGSFSGTTDFDPGAGTTSLTSNGGSSDIFVSGPIPGALPVELTRFEARLDGAAATLTWQTASETNNAGFEVEHRSVGRQDGSTWQRLGFVAGKGTTDEAQTYTYHAAGLMPGTHLFRLRQVDYDGAFEYSPEIEVTVGVLSAYVLSEAYPNPFNPQTAFTLAVQVEQRVQVRVFDLLGRQVSVLHDGLLEAGEAHRFTFGGASLPSGTYLLSVEGETFQASQKLVLMK